jgi:hypothetical protein
MNKESTDSHDRICGSQGLIARAARLEKLYMDVGSPVDPVSFNEQLSIPATV